MQNKLWTKGIVIGIILLFFGASVVPLVNLVKAQGPVFNLRTQQDFFTIGDAIADLGTINGDTIIVDSGTFHETIVINKGIDLIGYDTGGGTPVIDANGFYTAVVIAYEEVRFEGFTVINAEGNGIQVVANSPSIVHNTISTIGQDGCGINLGNWDGDGICYDGQIFDNTILNNFFGIVGSGSGCSIYRNVITNNWIGIDLLQSGGNSIYDNIVTGDYEWGIYLSGSPGNYIFNNNFNNWENAYDDASNGINYWYLDKTEGTNIMGGPYLGGNYWGGSNGYSGVDSDGDGIGDTLTPYNSNGYIQNGGDYLPLIGPAEPSPIQNLNTSEYFDTIQAAISDIDTVDGNIIQVSSGTYQESIIVGKRLTLLGVDTGSGRPIIDANGELYGCQLNCHNITLKGFVVMNAATAGINTNYLSEDGGYATIQDNIITNNGDGILLYDQTGFDVIADNDINNNSYNGIDSYGNGKHNVFTGNSIQDNQWDGILVYYSCYSTFENNTIKNNLLYGIYIGTYAHDNLVDNNFFSGNVFGNAMDDAWGGS